jgi:hypothetical protein
MLLLVVFQTVEIIHNRDTLTELRAQQEAPLQEAAKVRRQFEMLAAGIAELAASGNNGARAIVEEMRREGVSLPQPKR